jgi:CheY-like chemotaxis protein/two-component sensor histidine kinase
MDNLFSEGKVDISFLENFANELKIPVNLIAGVAALLGEPETDEKTRASYNGLLLEAGDRLMSMASDVQEICNIKSGKTRTDIVPVNLNRILRELHEKYFRSAAEKKVKFSLDLFERGEEVAVLTDSDKLFKILSNLLSNAIKFTSEGFVRFGYRVKDDFVEFHVSDSGIGIQEKYLESIFDHNFRKENPSSVSYGGTGMGLYISKSYIELLGGRIYVSSTPGSGSVFRFTLPVQKGKSETLERKEDRLDELCNFKSRKTILVAEDMDSNYMLITLLLKGKNIEIKRACNGKEALDMILAGDKFDLILMDIKMPVMDGLTATRKIRETGCMIPVIAQTAYIEDKQIAFDIGCNGFVSKPFDRKKLLQSISGLLE